MHTNLYQTIATTTTTATTTTAIRTPTIAPTGDDAAGSATKLNQNLIHES